MDGEALNFMAVMQIYIYSLLSGFGMSSVIGFTAWGVASVVRLFNGLALGA